MRRVVLTGRQGPAFGTRPSVTHLEAGDCLVTVGNFARGDRGEALEAAFDTLDDRDIDPSR